MHFTDFKTGDFRKQTKLRSADQKDVAIVLIAVAVAIEPDAIILIHGQKAAIAFALVQHVGKFVFEI